jgi:ubiquitin carboxyl-terminal hydrolase 8
MDLTKYKSKGRIGLENLGNTCFLNACMQVLSNTYELNHILDVNMNNSSNNVTKEKTPNDIILTEWNELRTIMWSGNGIIAPRKFVHNVQQIAKAKDRDLFTGHAQNDMPEFLLFFMDCIHSSISRNVKMNINGVAQNDTDRIAIKCYEMLKQTYLNEYSEIMDMFYGIYISMIESKDKKILHSIKPESFFILDLPITDNVSVFNNLYDCLNHYTKPELLDGENAWYNEKTKQKEDVKKQIRFWNFPQIVTMTLNRFTADGTRKINNNISFPVDNLDLSPYACGYKAASYQYELYGICNHIGGVTGGHYTAFVRNVDNIWLHYNDKTVEIVGENPEGIVSPAAYCLFYRKKNNQV